MSTPDSPLPPSTHHAGAKPAFTLAERGFLVGVIFGLLALVVDLPSSLAVLGAGLLGALLGAAWSGVKGMNLDVSKAMRVLIDRTHPD